MVNVSTAAAAAIGSLRLLAPRREKLTVFDSWGGRFSGSPKAIYEALLAENRHMTSIWVLQEGQGASLDPDVPTVRPNSIDHARALSAAGTIVTNTHLPRWFVKRPGTRVIQTWHGTPLKRIGWHLADTDTGRLYRNYLRSLSRDVSRWDLLVSQSDYSSNIFREAFRYAGKIVESGTPGNDVLTRPTARLRGRVQLMKEKFGLREGQTVALIAPTFRDDTQKVEIDLISALESAPDIDVVFLVRLHNNSRARSALQERESATLLDVSDAFDADELFLLADVLVTDYSSVMFDYAVTGKPILLYCPDLRDYESRLRGFYLNLAQIAPGPLLQEPGDLLRHLSNRDWASDYSERYREFRERFCYLEDGEASGRVLRAGGLL